MFEKKQNPNNYITSGQAVSEGRESENAGSERRSPHPQHHSCPPAPAVATSPATANKKAAGLTFRRFFTKPGVSPYDEVEWELRTANISDAQGNTIFEQKDVEVPKTGP